jgi:transposase
VDAHGEGVIRKQLTRGQGGSSFAQLPSCLVGLEAWGGAPSGAREWGKLGPAVGRRAVALLQPSRATQQNAHTEAAASGEAGARPRARFVAGTSEGQQAGVTVPRAREL